MSVPRGPLRIVLVRSGGYDYADLPLHEPVHLVAANNVGKTTLIAALQFLYVDDLRQMHFSHDAGETRRHYFPHAGSLVLFECMTPTGLRVLGLRGLGPVRGFEFERFTYAGAYDRADYLDARTPRAWEDVARRLVGRGLEYPEPRHLRASLLGTGDAKGPPLGLVPLKRSGSYESFRFLFRNLLRLSRIDQEQLKRLFIDVAGPRLRAERVDLRSAYAEIFARATRDADDVDALERIAPAVRELVALHRMRETSRSGLARLWIALEDRLRTEHERSRTVVEEHRRERDGLAREESGLRARQKELQKQLSDLGEERGRIRTEIRRTEELGGRVAGFLPEIESGIRAALSSREDRLVERIGAATAADRRDVERRLADERARIAEDERLVARFGDAVVTWLRAHSDLPDVALNDVFRVLNPSLLGQVVGEAAVEIRDPDALRRVLRAILAGCDAGSFSGAGVAVPRQALDRDEPLRRYQDVEVVRARIAEAASKGAALERVLADIVARDALLREREEVRRELVAAEARLRDWIAWREADARLPGLREALLRVEGTVEETENAIGATGTRLTTIALRRNALEDEDRRLRAALEDLMADVRRLPPPAPEWEPAPEPVPDGTPTELVQRYRTESSEQVRLTRSFETVDADVEERTAGRHRAATEEETIRRLQDELAALEDRRAAVRELWTSVVEGMRSEFKALLGGLDEIRRDVSRLTQALSARRVSNLERVELELVRQDDLVGRLEGVLRADAAPLFAGPEGRAKAAGAVAAWLRDRPVIELADLFDLRFRVVDRAGRTKTFDSLSRMESQGTSITIRVLVHLELLRTMLADEEIAVPFFLDEVATLDERNLRGLVDHAASMGFVPIVASPEARDTIPTLCFLRPAAGGLVLDETSRVVIRREPADGD